MDCINLIVINELTLPALKKNIFFHFLLYVPRFSSSEGSLVTLTGNQKMSGCVEEEDKSDSPVSTHHPPDVSDEADPSDLK